MIGRHFFKEWESFVIILLHASTNNQFNKPRSLFATLAKEISDSKHNRKSASTMFTARKIHEGRTRTTYTSAEGTRYSTYGE